MDKFDPRLNATLIIFGAAARVIQNTEIGPDALRDMLNPDSVAGLAAMYEKLREFTTEYSCRFSVACNTISLLHKAALDAIHWGDGSGFFDISVDQIKC